MRLIAHKLRRTDYFTIAKFKRNFPRFLSLCMERKVLTYKICIWYTNMDYIFVEPLFLGVRSISIVLNTYPSI